jgi:hypothetical protein
MKRPYQDNPAATLLLAAFLILLAWGLYLAMVKPFHEPLCVPVVACTDEPLPCAGRIVQVKESTCRVCVCN